MNAKNRLSKLSNESHGSLAAWLPRIGDVSPSGDVSLGNPGISASKSKERPPFVDRASPCHASSETASVRTSFIPTAMSRLLEGWTAIEGSFCCSTSAGDPTSEKNGSPGKKSCVDTRTFAPASDGPAAGFCATAAPPRAAITHKTTRGTARDALQKPVIRPPFATREILTPQYQLKRRRTPSSLPKSDAAHLASSSSAARAAARD